MKERACELCNEEAAVYCPSDSAFLCLRCDAKVHEANFLVARHIRHAVCFNCNNFSGNRIPGADFHSSTAIDFDDSLSSSACISSTTSPAKEYSGGRNQGSDSSSSVNRRSQRAAKSEDVKLFKAEAIFVNWCGKLGVREYDVVVRTACSVLRVCLDGGIVLPFRVFLAASMWLAAEKRSAHLLKRLEEVTGVPAKVILSAESKMARALRGGGKQQQPHLEEGWDES